MEIHHVFVNPRLLYQGLAATMPWQRSKFYVTDKPHPRHAHYADYPILQYVVAMISPCAIMEAFMIVGTYLEDDGWREGQGCVVVLGECLIHVDVGGTIKTTTVNSGDLIIFNGGARYCLSAVSERPITLCFITDVKVCDPNEAMVVRRGVGKKRKVTYETRAALAALSAGNIICGLR